MDRQLTALLRTSAVPAPEATRTAVLAAVRAEAHEHTSRSAPLPERAGRPAPSPRRPARRRHWVALAAALVGAAAVVATSLLVVPAPDPGSPLSAAWSSYHHEGKDGLAAPARPRPSGCSPSSGRPPRTPT